MSANDPLGLTLGGSLGSRRHASTHGLRTRTIVGIRRPTRSRMRLWRHRGHQIALAGCLPHSVTVMAALNRFIV